MHVTQQQLDGGRTVPVNAYAIVAVDGIFECHPNAHLPSSLLQWRPAAICLIGAARAYRPDRSPRSGVGETLAVSPAKRSGNKF